MELLRPFLELRQRAISERQRANAKKVSIKEMPHVFGLMAIASSSGLTGELALRAISPFAPESISDQLHKSLLHIESGKSFRTAIEEWYGHTNLRPMARILIESMESGTSALPAFESLGLDALNKVRRNSEAACKKLPVTMLIPLVVCILPAFMLLSVVPTLISGFSGIDW